MTSEQYSQTEDQAVEPLPSKPIGDFARVIITEIRPEANYKTLKITHFTTAFEVIVKCIQKYAMDEDDKDPDSFYLTEVQGQGCQCHGLNHK